MWVLYTKFLSEELFLPSSNFMGRGGGKGLPRHESGHML